MKACTLLAIAAPVLVSAQQSVWGQCGGIGWTGETSCTTVATCSTANSYYAQCWPTSIYTTTTCSCWVTAVYQTITTTSMRTTTTMTTTTTTTTISASPLPTGPPLHTHIKQKGKLYLGFAADTYILTDTSGTEILLNEGGQITPNISFNWNVIEPQSNQFVWSGADMMMNFALSNRKLVRGALLWHSQIPGWVSAILTKASLIQAIQNHVGNIVWRYRGYVYAWDIAKDVFADTGGLRTDSHFNQVFGSYEYLEYAFKVARQADPNAKLCLSDYGIDYPNIKLNNFIQAVRDLKARGVPIDCVSTQSHLVIGAATTAGYRSALNGLASGSGLEVQITELDIASPSTSITAAQLTQQRADYATVVDACMQQPACSGITIWGISDARSGLTGRYPLLWDVSYVKKPAYFGVVEGIY